MYDIVYALDGARGITTKNVINGGIRGNIKQNLNNSTGNLVHVFSRPIDVTTGEATDIEEILHMIRNVNTQRFVNKKIDLCLDSRGAIEAIR